MPTTKPKNYRVGIVTVCWLLVALKTTNDVFRTTNAFQVATAPHSIGRDRCAIVSTQRSCRTRRAASSDSTTANDVRSVVGVTGATGKTGQFVVKELLLRNYNVVAMVRNETKANSVFCKELENTDSSALQIVTCNLANETNVMETVSSCDSVIWCATGFVTTEVENDVESSSGGNGGIVGMLQNLFSSNKSSQPETSKQVIDSIGVPAIAKAIVAKQQSSNQKNPFPKIIHCSSAGVTRSVWDDKMKQELAGAADIPIIRLNPFHILDRKRESEMALRAVSGAPYCIVRPVGLNDENWTTSNARVVISQGDVAVGRITRRTLATFLVDMLSQSHVVGKTIEICSIAGYIPSSASYTSTLKQCYSDTYEVEEEDTTTNDGDGSNTRTLTEEEINMRRYATYSVMQQLLPGEQQDSAGLAMGQTYEQYDTDTTGRFGKRGEENISTVTKI